MPDSPAVAEILAGRPVGRAPGERFGPGRWKLYADHLEALVRQMDADNIRARAIVDTTRQMVEDGHPCGSAAGDEWFEIVARALSTDTPEEAPNG